MPTCGRHRRKLQRRRTACRTQDCRLKRPKALGAKRKAVILPSPVVPRTICSICYDNGYPAARPVEWYEYRPGTPAGLYEQWWSGTPGEEVVSGSRCGRHEGRHCGAISRPGHADDCHGSRSGRHQSAIRSLVVNYDLPWNPQRIEQRIGRCHRYGQQHDVVVVNFLNRRNEADLRVFQLLSEKFQLFDGVFGASDEVLGALESGVDIERRIAQGLSGMPYVRGDPIGVRPSVGAGGAGPAAWPKRGRPCWTISTKTSTRG